MILPWESIAIPLGESSIPLSNICGQPDLSKQLIIFDLVCCRKLCIRDMSKSSFISETSDSVFDEVYIINDSLSVIGNKNYIFQFARRNRPPVLNYINKYPSYLYNPSDISKDI